MLPDHELGPHLEALAGKFEAWLAPKRPLEDSKMTAGRLDAIEKSHCRSGHDSRGDRGQLQAQPATNPTSTTLRSRPRWHGNRTPPRSFWRAKCARCGPQLFAGGTTQLNAMAAPEGTM